MHIYYAHTSVGIKRIKIKGFYQPFTYRHNFALNNFTAVKQKLTFMAS